MQVAAATGTTWSVTNLTAVSLAPGQYYLIQEAAGAGGTTNLPTPDATGSIAMSATASKVALVNTTTAFTVSCPTGASIMDFVGYGTTANCFEGAGPTPAPSNNTAVLRGKNGCTDADVNSTDFATGAPNPRNTATVTNQCPGTIAPPDGAPQFAWFDVSAFIEGTRDGKSQRNRALAHHAARTRSGRANPLGHTDRDAIHSPRKYCAQIVWARFPDSSAPQFRDLSAQPTSPDLIRLVI